jgi:catechol 2,3-dioxygenase-like lactoylglutathione lyase family enzyme
MDTIDMKLEAVAVPVSDVDRSKRFYQSLGWRLDGREKGQTPDEAAEAAGRYMQDELHIAAL